jgi:hypothetical protein
MRFSRSGQVSPSLLKLLIRRSGWFGIKTLLLVLTNYFPWCHQSLKMGLEQATKKIVQRVFNLPLPLLLLSRIVCFLQHLIIIDGIHSNTRYLRGYIRIPFLWLLNGPSPRVALGFSVFCPRGRIVFLSTASRTGSALNQQALPSMPQLPERGFESSSSSSIHFSSSPLLGGTLVLKLHERTGNCCV